MMMSEEARAADEGWALDHYWEHEEDEPQPHHQQIEEPQPQQQPGRSPSMNDSIDTVSVPLIDSLPPQLHPAVSIGMQRVSSCYFSLDSNAPRSESDSVADLLSLSALWEDAATAEEKSSGQNKENEPVVSSADAAAAAAYDAGEEETCSDDLLYHDILMNVFTFLDASDLTAFSETARRPNFECFYFLQLQLQRALVRTRPTEKGGAGAYLTWKQSSLEEPLTSTPGVGRLDRLSELDRPEAEATLQEFIDSNSTLKRMPLSHSLAYIREVLRSHQPTNASSQALASAAFFVTMLGAASFVGAATSAADVSHIISTMEELSNTELPNVLFKVGFMGSLMGAAKTMTESDRAERLRLTMRQQSMQAKCSFSRLMHAAYSVAYGDKETTAPSPTSPSTGTTTTRPTTLITSNPYYHPPRGSSTSSDKSTDGDSSVSSSFGKEEASSRKIPSGCVGAYSKAIHRAGTRVRDLIKRKRKSNFECLPEERQQEVSSAFIDACCSDSSLELVKDFVLVRGMVDVEGFYVGNDGTETCALHAAAFHGSSQVLEFLCRGIDESDPERDGGLCDVNRRDANGWTAAHFAAGANSVKVVEILASHGADFSIEASNGYTPLQWATRLQHHDVAEELRKHSGTEQSMGWMARQPLSAIANRFFQLTSSH